MPQIVLRRSYEANSVLRAFGVLLDGQAVAKVRAGRSVTLATTPGHHRLQVRIDWTSSQPYDVDLADGDAAHLVCGPAQGYAASLLAIFTRPDRFLTIRTEGTP